MSEQPAPWTSGVNLSLRMGLGLPPSTVLSSSLLYKSHWNQVGTDFGREIFSSSILIILVTSKGFHGDKTKEPGGLGKLGQTNPPPECSPRRWAWGGGSR